jgi:carbon-monoxide dehydrogenase small subunit/xanthine dehydrogenase small subunit
MKFTLNGKRVDVEAHPMKRLLDVLRECGLTGTKEEWRGRVACTVLLDGDQSIHVSFRSRGSRRASRRSRA